MRLGFLQRRGGVLLDPLLVGAPPPDDANPVEPVGKNAGKKGDDQPRQQRGGFEQIDRIRAARPDIALSGDFIVGFPGETEAEFQETLSLVRRVGYAQAYSFKYSPRPGTPAAEAEQVAEPVKAERLARLQALLVEQQASFQAAQVGRVLPVLFEKPGRKPGQRVGRSPYLQAVHAEAPADLLGRIAPVRIVEAGSNSLAGVLDGVEGAAASA